MKAIVVIAWSTVRLNQFHNIPGNEGRYGGKDILASQIPVFIEEVKRNEEAYDKFQEQS